MQLGGNQTPLPYSMELRHQQLLQFYDYKVSFVIFQHLQTVLLTHVTQKSAEVCATRFFLSPCLIYGTEFAGGIHCAVMQELYMCLGLCNS